MEVLILVLPAKHTDDDDDVFVLRAMVGWQTSKEGNNLIRYFLGQADNTCHKFARTGLWQEKHSDNCWYGVSKTTAWIDEDR
jgi:hypothetical protein